VADQQKYPYTTVPGKLRDLLRKAPAMGRPDKLTVAWLKKAGWTSSNDPSMIPVLKFVGIVGSDGRPTELWDAVRVQDQEGRGRVAAAVRKAYADLFSLYPDAHRKDAEAVRNFFRANTSGGEQVQTKTVQTFQVLAEFGDFDAPLSERVPGGQGSVKAVEKGAKTSGEKMAASVSGVSLNVNIQLQLPATSDGEVYEKLFSAMRRHLMGLTEATS
jgi:hypothetical protein